MLYVDKNLHRGTEHDEDSGFTHREATAAPDNRVLTTGPTPCLRSEFGLNVIHPVPDENNQIHVQINVPTLIVVKVLSGEKARSSWSAPVLQTGVHFLPSCPEEVALSWPDCWRQSPDAWFSSVILVLPSAGVQTLNISVMDAVSSQTVSVRVCGYEAVTGLTVEQHGCQRMLVDTSQSFQAKVESGSAVKFTWVIDDLEEFAYEGESYSVVFKKPAKYKLRLTASNHVSSQSQQVLLTADEITPLGEPEFLLVREVIAVDATHLYTLRVKVDISLPVTFRWDFGDGSSKVIHTQSAPLPLVEQTLILEASTEPSTHAVVYTWDFADGSEVIQGIHSQNVLSHSNFTKEFNVQEEIQEMDFEIERKTHPFQITTSSAVQLHGLIRKVLDMEVEEPQCSRPQASLVQSQSTIFRSRPSFFEASMDITCSAYKATYLWEIFKESDCTNLEFSGNKVVLRSQGTPLLAQQKTSVTVVHSMLVAVIKGGSHRLWPSLSDLVLDGSESEDPDVAPGVEDILQYHWTFMTVNSTESHFPKAIGSNSSIMTVLSTQLHSDTVYVFSLTVHKAGRRPASVNQTVTVCDAPVLPVIVECVSCSVLSSAHHVSYNAPIILSGQCGQCDDQAQYIWSAEDQTGITLSLNTVSTSTGRHSSNLVVRSGVLQPGQSYTFTLNVSQPGRGQWGSASLTLLPNNPPHGGLCDLSPESDIHLLETVVTYNCSGWRDDESRASQLIYTFQVAPSQPIGTLLTLYRGTRSTFGTLVPIGSPGQERSMSVITVTLLVEDHLGAKVIALNRMLTVDNPAKDGEASQWLRIKSQTELWALVQHGNPQEIIPYSIALTSQLNQMEPVRTAVELMDRREIRENVAQALASLPVSSLLHVDQISSALSLATAVPSELVCEKCQQKVLEAVGKMIHVMEEQMSLGVLSAVETGKNILNILGSILAAVSESVSASRSHPAHTRTLQSDSTTAQSALGHAGALMRSLMRSRVHGEAPLSLSTDYINTVGFHGDPSDLLCSPQSNQNQIIPSESSSADALKSSRPCPFHIPSSLTAHLKSQKLDVVQILFGMDAELGSNPLLTGAVPPISTALVAMELSTPQGQPIPIQDLDMERAIRVTLPNKYPVGQSDGREGEAGNGTCLTVNLSTEGRLNLTVKAVDELGENAGLFISFNFSLDPGAATPAILGRVKIEVSSTVPGTNASQNSLVRELTLTLSAPTTSTEETIFLSPLLDRTDKPLSVNLTWSLADGCPVQVSVCVFSSLCQYYSVKERRWSSEGLQPLEGSTLHSARCLTQHLTMFGASVFIHPGAVVLLPPPGGPVRNVLVGIVCAVLVLIHLLAGLIAHKLDHLDSLRLSQVPLCGQAGLYHYRVLRGGAFQRGSLDQFHLETDDNLGDVWKIRIWHDNTGLDPSWYVEHVVVWDPQTDNMFIFLLEDWLSVENQKNGSVEKEVLASCPEELSQFGRVFTSQMMFGMVEDHLWLSLWERPAHSRFTRGQRVTCSALTLHLYLALGALWKAHSQVTLDTSVPPSPVCHSVEMDVYLGQSGLSGPSFLSLPDSSNLVQDSPSSLLESKGLDSSILDFWAASGLVPRTGGAFQEEGIATWPSCDSVLDPPVGPCLTKTSPALSLCKASLALGPVRQLRRKKALMQL
ncbi:hypothetical protein FQN60_002653 [Etheostoma spectabile]|uniref:Polycystin-1 n=1 Tax=Etheostoma spectabile TaxID=54343 RepID=A0A5J5CGQ9_9PERO|nr:hypothetical protein FQN60_002653 [Etheostoma spectabile]